MPQCLNSKTRLPVKFAAPFLRKFIVLYNAFYEAIISEWTDAAIPLTQEGMDSWFKDKKQNSGFDFPNLPYLVDDDLKFTQSCAILRHLGRKFDLMPSDAADIVRVECFEQYLQEVRNALTKVCYSSEDKFEDLKADFIGKLDARMKDLDNFIGDGPYALGDKITYVDFMALEYLDHVATFSPDHFQKGPTADFLSRMKNLPALKKFYESDDCTHKSYTINAPFSAWPGWPNKQ